MCPLTLPPPFKSFSLCLLFWNLNMISLSSTFDVYSSWCSLRFFGLWFGVYHWFWILLGYNYFQCFFCYILSSHPGILIMNMSHLLKLSHMSWMFCFFIPLFFVFQFGKFLLTYLKACWLFPQLFPVYWWAHQRHYSFLLQCFWFIAFPFYSSTFHVSAYIIQLFLHAVNFFH